MRLAAEDLIRPRWTNAIHDEWIRSVLQNRPDLTNAQLLRTRELMDAHVPSALVTGYQRRIKKLRLPDPDDRHVLAAAIHASATAIVTFNISDFPTKVLQPHGIISAHPDPFCEELLTEYSLEFCKAVRTQREHLRKPRVAVEQFLDILLQQGLRKTVQLLRTYSAEL